MEIFSKNSKGIGSMALSSLINSSPLAGQSHKEHSSINILYGISPLIPEAKKNVYIFKRGGPSQMDIYDYKFSPLKFHGHELPGSIRKGQRLTGMSAGQPTLSLAGSEFDLKQHDESQVRVSELMPHTAQMPADYQSMPKGNNDHPSCISFTFNLEL